jgi:hypothetical protein
VPNAAKAIDTIIETSVIAILTLASAQRITRSAASGLQEPKPKRRGGCRYHRKKRTAAAVPPCKLKMNEALQRRAGVRPLVGCYAELGGADHECDHSLLISFQIVFMY